MKEHCWKLFSYLTIDHRAAQDFLNEMAEQGWELDKLVLRRFARFKRTQRADLRYFLDWADPRQAEDPEYVRICAEAGWYIKEKLGYWNLYESREGFSPAPIQTDPDLEYQRFRKKALKRAVITGAVFFGLVLLLLGLLFALARESGGFDWESAVLDVLSRSVFGSFALVILPLLAIAALLRLGLYLRRIRGWKRALERDETLTFSRRVAEVWKRVNFLSFCLAALLLLSPLLRPAMPERFPAAPVIEGAEEGLVYILSDAPLGSQKAGAGRAPVEGGSEVYWYSAQTWALPSLAQWAEEKAAQGLRPVPGQEGVWASKEGTEYLLRRGNTLLELSVGEDAPEGFYKRALPWMEQ